MLKYIRIYLSKYFDDKLYKHLPFYYYLYYNDCKYAGYKQLERWGLDADYLVSNGLLSGPNKTGAYMVHCDVFERCLEEVYPDGEYYYLCVSALFLEKNLSEILKERNDIFVISEEEFCEYDTNLYNCLTKQRRNIVDNTRKESFSKGQYVIQETVELQAYRQLKRSFEDELYEYQPQQLREYFENKEWSKSCFARLFKELYDDNKRLFATRNKKEDVSNSLSTTSTEGSSTNTTNGK